MSKEKIAFIPKQYFAVVAVLLAIMMSVLDGTIMNIALPTLAHPFQCHLDCQCLSTGDYHDLAIICLIR